MTKYMYSTEVEHSRPFMTFAVASSINQHCTCSRVCSQFLHGSLADCLFSPDRIRLRSRTTPLLNHQDFRLMSAQIQVAIDVGRGNAFSSLLAWEITPEEDMEVAWKVGDDFSYFARTQYTKPRTSCSVPFACRFFGTYTTSKRDVSTKAL